MERNNGRYNSYNNHNRRGGHQPVSLSSSNNNQQHLDNHHHHHQPHHHRNVNSSVGAGSSSHTSPSAQYGMHANNANLTATSMSNASSVYGREPLTQHDELIRYIKEAWTKVSEQGTPIVYRNESDQLKNFKPFNLEEYWGQRVVQNIHVSHGHQ